MLVYQIHEKIFSNLFKCWTLILECQTNHVITVEILVVRYEKSDFLIQKFQPDTTPTKQIRTKHYLRLVYLLARTTLAFYHS